MNAMLLFAQLEYESVQNQMAEQIEVCSAIVSSTHVRPQHLHKTSASDIDEQPHQYHAHDHKNDSDSSAVKHFVLL
jgi:hypothetical protein